ncbi:hypothetical protein CMI48_00365 [Candidatus Pacearchaeota archaeon]|nr:hypothetical protein [Candidatus Pacearchaeota archaeon]
MDETRVVEEYEEEVRKIAFWYYRVWPFGRDYGSDDLLQAGRIGVMQVARNQPEMICEKHYVKKAIRSCVINEIKRNGQRIKKAKIVRFDDDLDVLPDYQGVEEGIQNRLSLPDYLSNHYGEEESLSILQLLEQCDNVSALDLTSPPETKLKENVRVVAQMDLSNDEMAMWAHVLIGARKTFPRDYAKGQKERAKKYTTFLLEALGVSPLEFVSSYRDKRTFFQRWHLDSFYQKAFDLKLGQFYECVFPDIEPYRQTGTTRWKGREGLINALASIDFVRRVTGKEPGELEKWDFYDNGQRGMLDTLFGRSVERAVEFRWPGTYPDVGEDVIVSSLLE